MIYLSTKGVPFLVGAIHDLWTTGVIDCYIGAFGKNGFSYKELGMRFLCYVRHPALETGAAAAIGIAQEREYRKRDRK